MTWVSITYIILLYLMTLLICIDNYFQGKVVPAKTHPTELRVVFIQGKVFADTFCFNDLATLLI